MKYLSLYIMLLGVYSVEPSQKVISAQQREQQEYLALMYSVFIGAGVDNPNAAIEALKCEKKKYGTKLPPPLVDEEDENLKKDPGQ